MNRTILLAAALAATGCSTLTTVTRLYRCAGPSCPGLPYKASDIPHPPTCAHEIDGPETEQICPALSEAE